MPKKTDAQLRREIEAALYWPGGSGGGGSRRGRSKIGSVVKPHARTSTQCKRCSQYHTTEEHDRHAHGGWIPRATKPKPKKESKAKVKAKKSTKAPSGSAAKPQKTRGSLSDAQKIVIVRRAVTNAPARDRHDQGVYISSVWDKVGKRLGMTLEQFKQWLVIKNREQAITLLRVDLVDTANPDKLEKSYIYDMGATFDLIKDDEHRNRFQA